VAALLLGSVGTAPAALTTESCLAKKLKEWGKLRNCQAKENGKALQGKAADPGKCQTKFADKLATLSARAADATIPCRYGVNGDGTATDYDTGSQWERKTDDGSVHDKDNGYTWSTTAGGPPNGTVYTVFLRALNGSSTDGGATITGCFAGHCDWRLSSIVELRSIVLPGCGGSPCIDQAAFGPTNGTVHWSDTVALPNVPLAVNFTDGSVGACAFFCSTSESLAARAVRSAL
jgi:hypothetical protein